MFRVFRNFFQFCSEENRKKFYVSIAFGVLSALFLALKIPAVAVVLQPMIDGNLTITAVWASLAIMLVSVIGSSVIKYRATMLQTEAGYQTAADKRIEIAEHLRYLPMGYFNENSSGQIASIATNTMENLADVATRVVMMVFEGILTTALIVVMIFFFDWRIALCVLAGCIVFFLVNSLLQRKAESLSQIKFDSDNTLVERIIEYVQGMAEVKSYHLTGSYNKRLEKAVDASVAANTGMELGSIPLMFLQTLISKLIGTLVCVVSIAFYCKGSMSLINCTLMLICAFMITEGLEKAGNYSALVRLVALCVEKAQEVLAIPEMDISGQDYTPADHAIVLDSVDFSYGQKKIIDDVSFTIPDGSVTALVGPSGGGKTTLCHLISRFWDVDGGSITLGGKNVKDYDMDALMRNFSFVFQNVYLFQDTVANNIRFGNPEASMDEVIAAAKKARCHEFIMNLPEGYETVIGEGGSNLSGGERQRLSIARAIMKDSPVIILDEATANVDPENEAELLSAIEELTRSKTVIMIAHRLKTVRGADQIFVIDQGKIAEQGTHEELMKNNGIYRRFVLGREQAGKWKIAPKAA